MAASAFHAKPKVGQAKGRTLILGSGDEIGGNPSDPISNLQTILTQAGYGVDTSQTLPTSLTQYKAIWYMDTNAMSRTEITALEGFVNAGHGLYLTGERPCCDDLVNASDTSVINALVTGGGVEAGGQGDADSAAAPNSINSSAPDDIAESPNVLTSWTPNEPGGMSGVAPGNVLTSINFAGQPTPTGAAWDGSSLTGGVGRLAILMDINWLEEDFWDQPTATQMVINMERFLMGATPVAGESKPGWAGYAAMAHGVRDVNGQWTVPTVDCSQDTSASAVGIWVGIDGFGNQKLVKAGVGVTCASPSAAPCYYLFTEVLPGAENPFTGCNDTVSPGDVISADITNEPFGSSTFIATLTDNNASLGPPITLTAPTKRDRSAECIVQLPTEKVGTPTPLRYKQLADFGSVSFTSCQATATQNAGDSLDTDQLASGSDGAFSVAALGMGSPTKPKASTGPADFPGLTWTVTWNSH